MPSGSAQNLGYHIRDNLLAFRPVFSKVFRLKNYSII